MSRVEHVADAKGNLGNCMMSSNKFKGRTIRVVVTVRVKTKSTNKTENPHTNKDEKCTEY